MLSTFHRRSTNFRVNKFALRSFARVLCLDNVDTVCVDILRSKGHHVDSMKPMKEDALLKIIGDYDALVVRSATKVTKSLMAHASALKAIGRAGAGVDNIDVDEASRLGILVLNTPGGNTVSTAQLTLSLMCNLVRHLPTASMSTKQLRWDRQLYMGTELAGKTLGVIGCGGRIGSAVAVAARAMNMKVIGFDPMFKSSSPPEVLSENDVSLTECLDDVWKSADIITVHTPLNAETENIINASSLRKCKHGVFVINCARGGIVDEAAALEALRSGRLAGLALDVYTQEPPFASEMLKEIIAHPRVVCTPHLGASTEEAQFTVARDIAHYLSDILDDDSNGQSQLKEYVGVVNASYLSQLKNPHMAPFVELAELLGKMIAQWSVDGKSTPIESVHISTWGGRDANIVSKPARSLLEAAVLKGVLSQESNPTPINLVSAPKLAFPVFGVQCTSAEHNPYADKSVPYWNVIHVKGQRKDGQCVTIAGSVFGSTPHIIQINEFEHLTAFKPLVPNDPSKCILSFQNQDKPGVVARALRILHEEHVNIASMNIARRSSNKLGESSDEALTFMTLDEDVPTKVMEKLQQEMTFSKISRVLF